MKTLATLVRHAVTFLIGLLVAWFTVHLTAPEELKTATDAANALVEPLVVVAGFVGVILSRLAMPFLSKYFRLGAGEHSDKGSAGGLMPCVLGLSMAAALLGLSLPSCAPNGLSVELREGTMSYSAKEGFNMEFKPGYGEEPEYYRKKREAMSEELRAKSAEEDFNPLDEPGSLPPTVEELHRANVRAITRRVDW